MINRHNYEEFFLMYVDNELSAEQRAAVELFVRQNPDLAEELEMFRQTKLPAMEEEFAFDKDVLLKNADEIGMDNYEEYFLLYIDNELGADKREAVEKFVLQHPQLQDAFTLLKQTVLENEAIIFEDKESLLRKEERRVIPLFIRIAIAAAVLGIIALVWWFKAGTPQNAVNNIALNQHQEEKKNIVVTPTPGKASDETNATQQQTAAIQAPVIKQPENEHKNNKEIASIKDTRKGKKKEQIQQPLQNNQQAIPVNNAQNDNNEHDIAVTDNRHTVPQNVNNNDPIVADNNPQPGNATTVDDQQENTTVKNTFDAKEDLANNNNNLVKPAVYKELNTDEDDKQRAVYVGSLELNKNAVRGFMKKVGGFFSGKNKE